MVTGAASRGSLTVVGTGIKVAAHASYEAVGYIGSAQKVFYLEADPLTRQWILGINPSAESLHGFYGVDKDRRVTYEEMVERVLECVRGGQAVCLASYGHPAVFAYPMHEAVRRARAEGYAARMLPAISAVDCLFADLGIDPASHGCQTFEATDFLLSRRRFDSSSALVLLQIGVIAERGYKVQLGCWNPHGVQVLKESLLEHYPDDYKVTVYEAAIYACCEPRIEHVDLSQLTQARVTPVSTLYVPPVEQSRSDVGMMQRLGLDVGPGRDDDCYEDRAKAGK